MNGGNEMKYISIGEVLTLNQRIQKVDLPYVIHVRDACGKQSFWIEKLHQTTDGEKLVELLTEFFQSLQLKIEFSEDGINFWISE